jgi:hypothetical protein
MPELLSVRDLPERFDYPRLYIRVVELGLTALEPWWLLEGEALRRRLAGLRERYPERELVPFAARQDRDDVACWDGQPDHVVIIHDFASPGWESAREFEDFGAWLRQAVEDLIEFDG